MGVSSSEPSQHSAPCSDLSFSPLPLLVPLPRPHPLSCSLLTVWLTDTPTLDSLEPTPPPTELLLPTPDTVLLPLLPLPRRCCPRCCCCSRCCCHPRPLHRSPR